MIIIWALFSTLSTISLYTTLDTQIKAFMWASVNSHTGGKYTFPCLEMML